MMKDNAGDAIYRGHRITRCDFSRLPFLVDGQHITEGYTFSAAPGATWARTLAECKELVDLYEETKSIAVNTWGGFWVEHRERKAARMGQLAYKGFFIRRADVWTPTIITTRDDYNDQVYFVAKLGENAFPNRPDGRSAYFRTVDEAIAAIDVLTAGYNLDPEMLWLKIETAIAADALDYHLPLENMNEATVLLLALDAYIDRASKGSDTSSLHVGSTAETRLRTARALRSRVQQALNYART